MTKIVRKPNYAGGGITPREKKQMDKITEKWISTAYRTEPIDVDKIGRSIKSLYESANLAEPRVVVVSSPLIMAFAYGAAAAIWHQRGKTDEATADATDRATDLATRGAIVNTTDFATRNATDFATRNATWDATVNATDLATADATSRATSLATRSATAIATSNAINRATDFATRGAIVNTTDFATRSATFNATYNATYAATDCATYAATFDATDLATADATDRATDLATVNATDRATSRATFDATYDATRRSVEEISGSACFHMAGELGVECAKNWRKVYQGGNMWVNFCAYAEAMRDVINLKLPEFDKCQAWEDCAKHGGFRVMHEKFCIVSDFPKYIKTDENNQPHCENGPSHEWRDGWKLYYWHGIQLPEHWIMDKENVDPVEILTEENVEKRAAGAEAIGWARMSEKLNKKIIDGDHDTDIGALVEMTLPGLPEPGRFLMAQCPRNGTICEGVPFMSDIDNLPIETAIAAQAWRDCLPQSEYIHPEIRT